MGGQAGSLPGALRLDTWTFSYGPQVHLLIINNNLIRIKILGIFLYYMRENT